LIKVKDVEELENSNLMLKKMILKEITGKYFRLNEKEYK